MDFATLLGILGAFGIVAGAVVTGGEVGIFINVPSILIVVGGTIFAVLVKFTLSQFLGAFKVAAKAFRFKTADLEDIIAEVSELADLARKNGLLALESAQITHPFLEKGIGLLVDGHEPEVVQTMMEKEMRLTQQRHKIGASIFTSLGDTAPAMGMVGTLIGLVQMLSNMSDPASIGPAMAVALLTTLYGALIANLLALPIADKLNLRLKEESQVKSLVIDALVAIQAGQNPRVIRSMLKNYLPERRRVDDA